MATHYQGTIAEIRALDAYIKLVRASESVVGRIGQNLRAEDGLTLSQFRGARIALASWVVVPARSRPQDSQEQRQYDDGCR